MTPRNQTNEWQSFLFTLRLFVVINLLTLFVISFMGKQDNVFMQSLLGWFLLSFLPSFVGMSFVYYQARKELA